jgi:ABC-type bacteriocin/lantibiotic exporter with double-glycine peptidase domain
MSLIIPFLDGVGLTLFVPLFQIAQSGHIDSSVLGQFDFVFILLERLNIEPSVAVILTFLVVLFIVKAIFGFALSYYSTRVKVKFDKRLRSEIVEGICFLSYQDFTKTASGRIHNVALSETGKVSSGLGKCLDTIQTGIVLLVYLTLAFLVNFKFAILVVITGLVVSYIYTLINKKVESASLEQSNIGNEEQTYLLESTWNFKYLKATGLISNYRNKIIGLINRDEKIGLRMDKIYALSESLVEPVMMIMVSGIIFVQVRYFGMSMYGIVLGLLFFYRSLTTFFSLQNTWQGFLTKSGGIVLVSELLDQFRNNKGDFVKNEDPVFFKSRLTLQNVKFSYSADSEVVLKDVSIDIRKNSTVAFVGESGSGKTTIVNMLAGLLLPDSGKIAVDDVPLNENNVEHYRNMIGYVTQEPVIFKDTLYNNVAFGLPKTAENLRKFWDVMEKTALVSTVMNMPEKEDYFLGDYGMLISGGQKQRIAIARELFRECSLLLMDEATSALDSENENVIQSNINALKGTYTIVIIAHRLSTVKNADRIYLLENGSVSASGTFNDLQKTSAKFREMVLRQEF